MFVKNRYAYVFLYLHMFGFAYVRKENRKKPRVELKKRFGFQ